MSLSISLLCLEDNSHNRTTFVSSAASFLTELHKLHVAGNAPRLAKNAHPRSRPLVSQQMVWGRQVSRAAPTAPPGAPQAMSKLSPQHRASPPEGKRGKQHAAALTRFSSIAPTAEATTGYGSRCGPHRGNDREAGAGDGRPAPGRAGKVK